MRGGGSGEKRARVMTSKRVLTSGKVPLATSQLRSLIQMRHAIFLKSRKRRRRCKRKAHRWTSVEVRVKRPDPGSPNDAGTGSDKDSGVVPN